MDDRNPLMAYADSYRTMAKLGDGRVDCLTVAVDIEQNMTQHARKSRLRGADRVWERVCDERIANERNRTRRWALICLRDAVKAELTNG